MPELVGSEFPVYLPTHLGDDSPPVGSAKVTSNGKITISMYDTADGNRALKTLSLGEVRGMSFDYLPADPECAFTQGRLFDQKVLPEIVAEADFDSLLSRKVPSFMTKEEMLEQLAYYKTLIRNPTTTTDCQNCGVSSHDCWMTYRESVVARTKTLIYCCEACEKAGNHRHAKRVVDTEKETDKDG